MLAVAQFGGHQAIVEVGDILRIDSLSAEVGSTVEFPVLLLSEPDGTAFQLGAPTLAGVSVMAKVLDHGKADKIRVFKMKRRKRYRRTYGHRQQYTEIEITSLGGAPTAKKSTTKKTTTDKSPKADKANKAEKAVKSTPKKAPAKKATPKAETAE